MKIVNLTPHPINIYMNDKLILTIESSGMVARCKQKDVFWKDISYRNQTIPLYQTKYGSIEDLPPKEENTYYIVSLIVAKEIKDREDILVPIGMVRDEKGTIIGCSGLAKV